MRQKVFIFIIGVLVGATLTAVTVVPVVARNKYKYGRNHGELMTKLGIVSDLPAVLGTDYRAEDGYTTFLDVKDSAIVVVERNGVKTLRVYQPGR
jgi:hypothetical protein